MDKSLLFQAMGKVLLGFLLMAALLFLPVGTLHYSKGWLLMALLFIPMLIAGVVMLFKSPDRLRKRLKATESEPTQRWLIGASSLVFVLGFVSTGLCVRFQRFLVPDWVTFAACIAFLFGYALFGIVLVHNRWLARTVELQPDQQVVTSGPYAVVRHPMYTAALLLFLSMPLILGAWLPLVLFLAFPFILIRRIDNEEQVLTQGLAGYADYKLRVKYRLIPFLW